MSIETEALMKISEVLYGCDRAAKTVPPEQWGAYLALAMSRVRQHVEEAGYEVPEDFEIPVSTAGPEDPPERGSLGRIR